MHSADDRFLYFLEQVVHPIVREQGELERYVAIINKYLNIDGYKLEVVDQISGFPLYRAVKTDGGVKGEFKNLIFSADGPKPEIVLSDSINNEILIVKNSEYCLVYNKPIPQTGLLWSDLVAWWACLNDINIDIETERSLYNRLFRSLDSVPERLLFSTYFRVFKNVMDDKLPALIPQVYLHYDPYTVRELKGERRIPRQRMDFLILFSSRERIIIEVDGKQHYSDDDNKADVAKYSEMVAADRALKLNGYDVYRFGGYELQGENGKKIVESFFERLFTKHHSL
jgi:very-short-patch-repair endonuclease